MNEKKAKVLEKLDESARVHDTSLRHSVNIAVHPEEHGWRKSLLTAMIVVPPDGVECDRHGHQSNTGITLGR